MASSLVSLFVVGGAEAAEAGVPAAGVVEAFDVPEDPHPGLLAGRESFASEELFLEAGEECLGDRVVPGVADRAHRELDPGPLGVGAVAQARVLRAVVGVGDQPAPSRPRAVTAIPSASSTSSALEVVAHRPADDPPAEHVLDGSEEQEALPGLDVLEVAHPEPVGLGAGEVGGRPDRAPTALLGVADRRPWPATAAVSAAQARARINRATRFGRPARRRRAAAQRGSAARRRSRPRRRRSCGSARQAARPRRSRAAGAPLRQA